jgi:hypothetical protein
MVADMKLHPSLTEERILEAVERFDLDDPGFCIACGHEQGGCESDMRKGVCESCGAKAVYGAEELVVEFW